MSRPNNPCNSCYGHYTIVLELVWLLSESVRSCHSVMAIAGEDSRHEIQSGFCHTHSSECSLSCSRCGEITQLLGKEIDDCGFSRVDQSGGLNRLCLLG